MKATTAMHSAELHQYIVEQAHQLFAEGGYERAYAGIPRCGVMLAPRYSVRHLAERVRGLATNEHLRAFTQNEATETQQVLIAWAFVRLAETAESAQQKTYRTLHIGTERLLRMDALRLCQLGFWLHLMVWPEEYCPSERDGACGSCALQSPR